MTYFKKCLMKHKFMYTQLTRTVLEMDFLGITLRENHKMSLHNHLLVLEKLKLFVFWL